MRRAWFLLGLVALLLLPWAAAQDGATPDATINASRLLLTLAAIIALGFAGFILFDRFRIADTIFLIGFGILLAWFGFLDIDLFRSFQPLIAVFAILIIMFDAGLDLRFGDLAIPKMGWGIAFATIGFVLTTGLVGAIGHYVLDLPWLLALLLGAAVTDTAGIVILPIVAQLRLPGPVKTAILVDTSLPDVYGITAVLLLMNLAAPDGASAAAATPGGELVAGFATTLLLGALAGFLWIRALGWLATQRYAYMTTLAAVLGINWLVNVLGGSGPLAVLLFGLVIGNRTVLGKWADVGRQKVFRDMILFNGEVAFLVRSFFFVYLGVILDVRSLTSGFVVTSLLILGGILASRFLAVYLMTARSGVMQNYRGFLVAAIPRGTTAAVLTTLPAARGIPGTEDFPGYAVAVILLTNVIFTVGLYLFFRGATKPSRDEGAEA